jgi:hypothetical protein
MKTQITFQKAATCAMPLVRIERVEAFGGFRQVVTWPTDDAVEMREDNAGI